MYTLPVEERVSRLEASYEHLATKADLYQMESRLVRWMIASMLGLAGLVAGVAGLAVALIKLL
jgi:hypothetical protein